MKRHLAAVLLSTLCLAARAEPQAGQWHDPTRIGTGISIHRSGDTIFATVLDYDPDRRPVWYFASSVRDTGIELDPGGPVFRGPLYRGEGTAIASQGPRNFAATEVGRITMWQFGETLTVQLDLTPPNCTGACAPVTTSGYYVKLL